MSRLFHPPGGDYRRRVSAAQVARREVTAGLSGTLPPDTLNPLIWQRGGVVRHQRRHRSR